MGSPKLKLECDVLVVGAAYAGLVAMLEASETGASVNILGRRNLFAGDSAIGGGVFTLVNTPLQREQGVRDSTELTYLFYPHTLTARRDDLCPKGVKSGEDPSSQ